jgi:hypothetical protein
MSFQQELAVKLPLPPEHPFSGTLVVFILPIISLAAFS